MKFWPLIKAPRLQSGAFLAGKDFVNHVRDRRSVLVAAGGSRPFCSPFYSSQRVISSWLRRITIFVRRLSLLVDAPAAKINCKALHNRGAEPRQAFAFQIQPIKHKAAIGRRRSCSAFPVFLSCSRYLPGRCTMLSRKLLLMVLGVGLLAAAASAQAATDTFNGGTGDYATPANWSANRLPAAGDDGVINGGRIATLSSDVSGSMPDGLYIGDTTGSGELDLVRANLSVGSSDWLQVGYTGPGIVKMDGGSVTANLVLLVGASAAGTFTQNAGAVTTSYFDVGYYPTGIGTYTLGGGSLSFADCRIGAETGSAGTFTQNGGSFSTAGGTLFMGDSAGAAGTYNMTAGTATVASFLVGNAGTGHLVVSGGSLTVPVGVVLGVLSSSVGNTAVINGGTVNVTNATYNTVIGGYGSGSLTVGGSGSLITAGLTLGRSSGSLGNLFEIDGGTVTVNGGTTVCNSGASADVHPNRRLVQCERLLQPRQRRLHGNHEHDRRNFHPYRERYERRLGHRVGDRLSPVQRKQQRRPFGRGNRPARRFIHLRRSPAAPTTPPSRLPAPRRRCLETPDRPSRSTSTRVRSTTTVRATSGSATTTPTEPSPQPPCGTKMAASRIWAPTRSLAAASTPLPDSVQITR